MNPRRRELFVEDIDAPTVPTHPPAARAGCNKMGVTEPISKIYTRKGGGWKRNNTPQYSGFPLYPVQSEQNGIQQPDAPLLWRHRRAQDTLNSPRLCYSQWSTLTLTSDCVDRVGTPCVGGCASNDYPPQKGRIKLYTLGGWMDGNQQNVPLWWSFVDSRPIHCPPGRSVSPPSEGTY